MGGSDSPRGHSKGKVFSKHYLFKRYFSVGGARLHLLASVEGNSNLKWMFREEKPMTDEISGTGLKGKVVHMKAAA